MSSSKIIKISFLNALLVAVYTTAVSILMSNGEKLFGKNNNFLGGAAVLMLFIISATIVGLLVLGRPIQLYLDGLKKEGIKLLFYTVSWLVLFTLIAFLILIIK